MNQLIDRDIRQRDIIPPEKLATISATIVGTGAIGRQVTIQLAAIGTPRLKLIDFDRVEVENLAPQGFLEQDMGLSKVDAVERICKSINSSVDITTTCRKFNTTQFTGGVLFCCVDGIETRRNIFNTVKNRANLFVDGRMSAEYMRIFTSHNDASRTHYESTLFSETEAYNGSCTAKTTIYCASIAAGLMVAQFTKWLRGHDLDNEIDVNLLTNEMGFKN